MWVMRGKRPRDAAKMPEYHPFRGAANPATFGIVGHPRLYSPWMTHDVCRVLPG